MTESDQRLALLKRLKEARHENSPLSYREIQMLSKLSLRELENVVQLTEQKKENE